MVRVADNERPKLQELAEEFWKEILSHSPDARNAVLGARYTDPVQRARYFAGRFPRNDPSFSQWWAKLDEAIIGFAGTALAKDEVANIYGTITDFYIVPSLRRRNSGSRSVEMLLDWLRSQGANRVYLNVRPDTPDALAFWRKVGFETVIYRMRRFLE